MKELLNQNNKYDYEMIFVDDGSLDNSLSIIKALRKQDNRVIYISLSRNFGHQNALFAGLSYCTGDAVITMDADLQHPPVLIPKMIELWKQGNEVVYTTKKNAELPFIKNFIVKCAYWIISKLSGLKLQFGQSDFRLIDKAVLKIILNIPEYHKFLRGQISWVGFKQTGLNFDVEPRYKGKAKYSYKSLFFLALDGIFSFSRYPLHVVTLMGVTIALISFMYMVYDVLYPWALKFFLNSDILLPPGWATLVVAVFFLGSVQLIAIGILGEYVGRIFDQTKGRPVFIVKEKSFNL